MSQNIPVYLRANGRKRLAASPMISDSTDRGLLPAAGAPRPRAERQIGSLLPSPSHFPAAQESAISVARPASSSLASLASCDVRFQPLADSMASRIRILFHLPDPFDAGRDS